MKVLLISFLAIFALFGCETLTNAVENHETKVRVGVALLIQGNTKDPAIWRERALATNKEVDELKVFLDFDQFTVIQMREMIQKRIISKGLDPARSIIYQEIVGFVESQISTDITTGLIKAEDKVTLDKYFSIIQRSASLYI